MWWQAPTPARADPATAAVTAMGLTGAAATAATIAINIGMSIALNYAAMKLQGKPRVEQQKRELQVPTSLPAYRFVYGETEAVGTPIQWHVAGKNLFVCYLLNSRASHGEFSVLIDRREVTATRAPYDLSGAGAGSTGRDDLDEHIEFWISRGDHAGPPAQFLSRAGAGWQASDRALGCTLMWAIFAAGDAKHFGKRWKAAPPEVAVRGKWSLVYDPRTEITSYSANPALCTLDALLNNPLRPYDPSAVWLDTFAWAATVADEAVPVQPSGTRPRYRIGGTLAWSDGAELETQLDPLLAAAGSRLIWSSGQIGIVPAVARSSVATVTDMLTDSGLEYQRYAEGDGVYTEGVAQYPSAKRSFESTETPLYVSPGAQAADGGLAKRLTLQLDMVHDDAQAQRLIKIAVERSRCQRRLATTLPPEHIDLVSGSRVTVAWPAPFGAMAGEYEIDTIHPAADLVGESGVALRLPVVMTEYRAACYAWTREEETLIDTEDYVPPVTSIGVPTARSAMSGGSVALISGGDAVARVRYQWSAPATGTPIAYEWQYRVDGGAWIAGGRVDADDDLASHAVYIAPVQTGSAYGIRVRAISARTVSAWSSTSTITATGPTRVIEPPDLQFAAGGAGRIDLTIRQASDPNATAVEIMVGITNNIGAATLLRTIPARANVSLTTAHTGLGAAVTRYYWVRAIDNLGNASAYTAARSATTT